MQTMEVIMEMTKNPILVV